MTAHRNARACQTETTEGSWRPIETAPIGEWVLVAGSYRMPRCRLVGVRYRLWGVDGAEMPPRWHLHDVERGQVPLHGDDYPTHWMPLPEPPK